MLLFFLAFFGPLIDTPTVVYFTTKTLVTKLLSLDYVADFWDKCGAASCNNMIVLPPTIGESHGACSN